MAEHKELLQALLPLHGLKGQKSSEGFSGSWPSEHQQIVAGVRISIESAAQQLDQLLLPLPRTDHGCRRLIPDVKAEGSDGGCGKDESF